ncbi:precorrin-4 C(11)-methyltransferase [Ralstonia solanacearum]|uniref:precorrin-4 C(11)-methyltransferase n=1 Tax=Ralstonia solanacearum TaxID=305 RepID=UPI00018174D4|nr:precorrin-4 C(11)-methyltransferase [Ralstonia solanacearum]MDC6177986.1 precorrin-4 C(11)-methyltransferase [Ralstonia solanacearum]MDC6210468.1 precorrin-4 C(11)-methyltransferase [Ralstonia solanacearum]MDC6238235.1 precorrin-4 C(11)-methyltransferase [Ralstonia solanacearum]MDD7800963.1 precorrin-4 C(11)-methyltransferase [Ralstonia solanacearum]TYZ55528.1 precorrin-4 C(11)-methyltransferase [Ralstonia solanacearum]
MKVYFIGAGPGAADLITLRGARLLGSVPMVLYAGSLVPPEMLQHCRPDAELHDTAALSLDEQEACYRRAQAEGKDVARLHSGDPAIYGATAEQMRRLEALGIDYEIVPGVSSFTAAAAVLGSELTRPAVSQSIVLTRVSGRASAVPELESVARFAEHQATMCIFLSGQRLKQTVADLLLHYPADTPVALVRRATWPDQAIHRATLGTLLSAVSQKDWLLTTLLLVGRALSREGGVESSLYAAGFTHIFRDGTDRKTPRRGRRKTEKTAQTEKTGEEAA